jgi:hypothetical protein
MLYVISGVDPNLDKFGWYDENISSKMVPNIDPKNSNFFFSKPRRKTGSWILAATKLQLDGTVFNEIWYLGDVELKKMAEKSSKY